MRKDDPQEDPAIIFWKIYYGDFSTFSSTDGTWAQAPNQGIQVILLWRADFNARIMHGRDLYWHNPAASLYTFGCTDDPDDVEGPPGLVKTGSLIGNWEFNDIIWECLLDVRELYFPGMYERIPPPDYLLFGGGG